MGCPALGIWVGFLKQPELPSEEPQIIFITFNICLKIYIIILIIYIYIIIWLSLYVLSVHSLSPPKPAGLDPPNFSQMDPLLHA
jgi:hypothetical protein